MKSKLLIILLFVAFGSNAQNNRSSGTLLQNFTGAVPLQQFGGTEIFRFRPGIVTQLDQGTAFNFTNSRWFSLGSLTTFSQTVYGLRFQLPNKALTFGYNDVANANPRVQWIGTGANLGNLEFRVADSFTSTVSTLVATMTNTGKTIFGEGTLFTPDAKVSITGRESIGLLINTNTFGLQGAVGFLSVLNSPNQNNLASRYSVSGASDDNIGTSSAASTGQRAIGFFGAATDAIFNAGVYGIAPIVPNSFAGFFDGDVFSSGSYQGSDAKLKENVKQESSVLEKLSQLKPVTYDYKNLTEINLPKGTQHGFIAQELATVFPELTKDISKPIFDKEGKTISTFEFKSVNYNGLISIHTAAIKELNEELKNLKEQISVLLDGKSSRKNINGSLNKDDKDFFMEQNIPNPFKDQTVIRFQLPKGTNTAEIAVFDMTGKPIKSYVITNSQKEITIKSSEIGIGLFIYSLVQNGHELVTKKMIVK